MSRSSREMCICLDATTGKVLGNATSGGIKFARQTKIEQISLLFYQAGTTSNSKQLGFHMGKNASTSVINLLYGSGVKFGTTTGFKRKTGTPSSAAKSEFTTADRFWINITNHTDGISKIKAVVRYRQ